jgi:hypothetical protein
MRGAKVGFGPALPVIIAQRFWCPSCDAIGGEPCRLSPTMVEQGYSHEARHQAARRSSWRQLVREIEAGTSVVSSLGFGHVR